MSEPLLTGWKVFRDVHGTLVSVFNRGHDAIIHDLPGKTPCVVDISDYLWNPDLVTYKYSDLIDGDYTRVYAPGTWIERGGWDPFAVFRKKRHATMYKFHFNPIGIAPPTDYRRLSTYPLVVRRVKYVECEPPAWYWDKVEKERYASFRTPLLVETKFASRIFVEVERNGIE